MKKLLLSLFVLSILVIPACEDAKNNSFDEAREKFVEKYKVLTGEKNLDGLTSRFNFVNKNISDHGILYDSLSGDSLLTGYDYGQFYDWDLYFENIYQMFNGESRYCYKNLNAFFIRQEANGHINRAFGSRDKVWCKQMFKPFIAQIVLLGMRQAPDKKWLRENYTHIVRYLAYWTTAYDKDHNNLSVWENAGHSGMDNQTSRVPKSFIDEGVDLNCYLYKEYLALAKLAEMIDYDQDAINFAKKAELIKKAINTILWDEKDGIYYDRLESTGKLNKVKGISCFTPMFVGIASKKQAEQLVKRHLTNKKEFWSEFPVNTLAQDEPKYKQYGCQPPAGFCNWNGTTWIPFNYMVFHGLMDYGYDELAEKLAYKTFEMVYVKNSMTREYYDADDGHGYGRKPFYGWSTLAYFMPIEYEMHYNPTNLNETKMHPFVKMLKK